MSTKPKLVYCSWSKYKREEWDTIRHFDYETGVTFASLIEFEFRKVATHEPLLRDLREMVHAKAISAYKEIHVPCVVEHAGLILKGHEAESYPGGLTQPMWDALGAENFLASCRALSDRAIARAVIGYCDGSDVKTFIGETKGTLRGTPAGARDFYWDTVFCPDGFGGQTYAEIADLNLVEKLKISQSVKALRQLVAYRRDMSPLLFPGF